MPFSLLKKVSKISHVMYVECEDILASKIKAVFTPQKNKGISKILCTHKG